MNDRKKFKYGPVLRTNYGSVVENVSSRTGWQHLVHPVVKVMNPEAKQDVREEGVLEFHSQQYFTRQRTSLIELNTNLVNCDLFTLAVGVYSVYCRTLAAPILVNFW